MINDLVNGKCRPPGVGYVSLLAKGVGVEGTRSPPHSFRFFTFLFFPIFVALSHCALGIYEI